jgi:hypothetical protein
MESLPHSLALLPSSTRIGLGKVPVKSAERYSNTMFDEDLVLRFDKPCLRLLLLFLFNVAQLGLCD